LEPSSELSSIHDIKEKEEIWALFYIQKQGGKSIRKLQVGQNRLENEFMLLSTKREQFFCRHPSQLQGRPCQCCNECQDHPHGTQPFFILKIKKEKEGGCHHALMCIVLRQDSESF
jgi:hypothetical protein